MATRFGGEYERTDLDPVQKYQRASLQGRRQELARIYLTDAAE